MTTTSQVFNAVVDHARIEDALLTPDSATAEALLEGPRGQQYIRHKATQIMYPQQSNGNSRKQLISKLFAKAGNVAEQVRAQTLRI